MERTFLTNQFLIAMPTLNDSIFTRSVVYICDHNEEGAMGVIINVPLGNVMLQDVLDELDIEAKSDEIAMMPVLYGGPVQQERGFILHSPAIEWNSTLKISNELAITTSQDLLKAIAVNKAPDQILVALGYAGWSADQLEQEISQNHWLSCPADTDILFHTPFEARWQKSAQLLGIDMSTFSGQAGHA